MPSILFEGTVIESSTLVNQQLTVNWNILSGGSIINDIPYTSNILLNKSSNGYQFSDSVNLSNTLDYTIIEGNELVIWLTLNDNSGQVLGFATLHEPLIGNNMVRFDPRLSLVELRTENPMDGEPLIIATRIVNGVQNRAIS